MIFCVFTLNADGCFGDTRFVFVETSSGGNVPLDPVSIAALRANGIALESHHLTQLLKQLEFGIWGDEIGPTGLRRLEGIGLGG